jgi:ribonuclease D
VQLHLHQDDLPAGLSFGDAVAVDTETMGLSLARDRLCLIQLSAGDDQCHLVQFRGSNLKAVLGDPKILKLFHFARFDLAIIQRDLGLLCGPVYCTKVASRLVRTFTDKHGLKDLCKDLLGVDISKQMQSSDWGADTLSDEQQRYAASDVLYLHRLRTELDRMLQREGRAGIAAECFKFLPARAALDLLGWDEVDIFAHH